MINDDWDLLIQCYLDSCASDDDCVRFEKIMRDSREARQRFWELAELHALAGEAFLISHGAGCDTVEEDAEPNKIDWNTQAPLLSEIAIENDARKSTGFASWASFAVVSCIVLIGIFAWRSAINFPQIGKDHVTGHQANQGDVSRSTDVGDERVTSKDVTSANRHPAAEPPHPTAHFPRRRGEEKEESLGVGSDVGLARIIDSRSALRLDQDSFFQTGQVLGAERIVLAAGVLEIALMSGISFVIEGPCDFELTSNDQAILHRGQAVVHVPNGMKTFRFDTDNIRVIDASSEFAIQAESESSTVIQAYDGIVQVTGNTNSTAETPTQVLAGKAVRYTSLRNAQPESIEFAPEKFIRRLSKDIAIERFDETSVSEFNQPVHEAIAVWKRRGPIEIDGELDDWPIAEGFRSVWDKSRDGREFVSGRMMYDDENLYISAHVGDPFPMINVMQRDTDSDLAWRGGGLQIRLWAERNIEWPADLNSPEYYLMRSLPVEPSHQEKAKNQRVVHLNLWYHAPTKRSCLHIAYGMEFKHLNDRINPPSVEGIFRLDEDDQGYILEYAIPWGLLNASGDPPRSGDRIPFTWTTHWSDHSGRVWRGQMNELRNANEPARVSSWERAATWGRAEFE